jgi:hypothetical protein
VWALTHRGTGDGVLPVPKEKESADLRARILLQGLGKDVFGGSGRGGRIWDELGVDPI